METKQTNLKINPLLMFAILFAMLATISTFAAESDHYRATASGNLLQVHTPEGTRIFFGDPDFGEVGSYRVEIPVSEITAGSGGGGKAGSGNGGNDADATPGPSMKDDLDQLFAHANDLYLKGKFAAAREFVKEILRRDPKNSRALVMEGSLDHLEGNRDAAKAAWKKALEVDPNNKTIQNILENYQ
jgi:tetratricopeptide (TPR) repeat protein